MAKPRWALSIRLVIVAMILAEDRSGAGQQGQERAQTDRPVATEAPRVRTDDPTLASLIRQATDRSSTFRRIVDAIQATDGVVYVSRGRCGHYVRACLPFWMVVAGPNRVVQVILDDRLQGEQAMAAIAHELRHTLEVFDEPSVTTGSGMYFFYRRDRSPQGEAFETQEAVDAGNAVLKELTRRLEPVK